MAFRQFDNIKSLSGPIFITGHTGFKGKWLTLLLDSLEIPYVGYSLEPLSGSLYTTCDKSSIVKEKFADIRNYESVKDFMKQTDPSAVIHLAAQPLVIESYKAPLDTFEVNVMGTANVLQASIESGNIRSIVSVTTDKVYKNDETMIAFSENDPLQGKDPYSASKVASESVIDAWREISKVENGPDIFSVRSGNVIGGGDVSSNRLMPDLMHGYCNKTKVQIRNPKSTRPWQHVLDPLFGYLLALEESLKGAKIRSYNFATDELSISVEDAVNIVKEYVGTDGINVEYQVESKYFQESKNLNLNSALATKKLGWNSTWKQDDAIRSTVEWWKKVKFEGYHPQDACNEDIAKLLDL